MVIQKIDSDIEKKDIARAILEVLPDWFGIPEATEAYIADSKGRPFFCAFADDVPVGFLYLKETGRHTVELAVMGVRQEYHRQGIGRALFEQAKAEAKRLGYSFIQVKPSRWADMLFTTTPTASTSPWGSRNWKCSQRCGTNGIPARFI